MTPKQQKIFKRMLKDESLNDIDFYKASDVIWKRISNDLNTIIENKGLDSIQGEFEFNSLYSYVLDFNNLLHEIPLELYYNFLKSKDTFNLLEKTKALPTHKLQYDYKQSDIVGRPYRGNERLLNWDYLITIDTIQTIAEFNPNIVEGSISICEIGAGWGRIGYYLTQINNKATYSIFDIPHVLITSHEYLRQNVNHTKFFDYDKTKNKRFKTKSDFISNPGLYFYTPHYLEKFEDKCFDLTINVASFQEMSLFQVSNYYERINRLSNMFYTQQRYNDLEMNYHMYPIYDNWKTVINKDVNFHSLWFEQLHIID